jgi:zinc and cadmium transporter
MTALGGALLATAAGGALSVVLAGALLLLPEQRRRRLLPFLLAYATGALLAASLLALLPEAIAARGAPQTLAIVLGGIVAFDLLHRALRCRHNTTRDADRHAARAPLVLIGDALHNFTDGAVIAAAFLTSIPLGLAAAVAVFAHEIPQEAGDFALLLSAGYSRGKALAANLGSAASALAGAAAAGALLTGLEKAIPIAMALSAASFLYLALCDLLPALHEETRPRRAALQLLALLAGIAMIWLFSRGSEHAAPGRATSRPERDAYSASVSSRRQSCVPGFITAAAPAATP